MAVYLAAVPTDGRTPRIAFDLDDLVRVRISLQCRATACAQVYHDAVASAMATGRDVWADARLGPSQRRAWILIVRRFTWRCICDEAHAAAI